jgi:hypothetical protein
MRLRDLVTNLIFLTLALVHFGAQWYAWKLHVDQVPAGSDWLIGSSPDQLWNLFSLPLFVVVPRRLQNLYFFEVLIANSALWGAVLSWGVALPLRLLSGGGGKRTRLPVPAPVAARQSTPRTGTDRLVELKRLRDEGLITREEYQRKRTTILLEI